MNSHSGYPVLESLINLIPFYLFFLSLIFLGLCIVLKPLIINIIMFFKEFRINRVKCRIAYLEGLIDNFIKKENGAFHKCDSQYLGELAEKQERLRQLLEV